MSDDMSMGLPSSAEEFEAGLYGYTYLEDE